MGQHPKTPINLFRGWPNPSLLPPEALEAAAGNVLTDPATAVPALQYGPDDGYPPLREEVARWLTAFYKPIHAIGSDRICITGGASQNLACLLQTFTDPVYTRHVWMVAPTYHLACRIFDDSGFAGRLRSVPEDDEGIDLDSLSTQISQNELQALADGNTEPVRCPKEQPDRLSYQQDAKIIMWWSIEIQAVETVEKDIQACHLCRSILRQPIR